MVALVVALVGVVCLSVGIVASLEVLTIRGALISAVCAAGAVYGVTYLVLYLRLSVEDRKRYTWSIRARLIVAALLILGTAPIRLGERAWAAWVLSVLVSVTAIVAVRAIVRRTRDASDLVFAPIPLLVADLLVIAAVSAERLATPGTLAAALSIAIVANVVSSSGRAQSVGAILGIGVTAVVASIAAAAGPPAYVLAFAGPVVFAVGGLLLTRRADAWHSRNVEQTLDDLTAFTLVPREEAAELLVTATGILTHNWNESRPTGDAAVGRWYEENSEYYLYDLSQFHLAYKHISFMNDIASLARGRVLDFGAGIGDLALELARTGHETVYVDVEGRTKAFARWRAERDWIPVQFSSELDDVEGEFDTIISLDVFEHLARPEPVIEALVGRLAPGGRLIVTAAFGPTKAHPMHFDHEIDLAAMFTELGLTNVKSLGMQLTRGEFFRKGNVLVFERR